ncbi:MAG: hypothetical protein GY873_02470 [Bosea sp.]|uniref:hypothetical protein n=1 Tax=Bosea sp. (in: a-proteobacteria) TaxID=1871050 RepID=UPI0023880746|nr:hypothetical protein [Bosea sp. (in: a-proteobacteria)]
MSAVLHICREHGWSLAEFDALDRGEQVTLLGELRYRDKEAARREREFRAAMS